MYSGLFIFPIFAQAVLGFTATKSGYFMLFPGLLMGIAMILSTGVIEKGVPLAMSPFRVAHLHCVDVDSWALDSDEQRIGQPVRP